MIGGLNQLFIVGLYHIPTSKDYCLYVTGIQMFDCCSKAQPLLNGAKLSKKISKIIKKLILWRLNGINYKNKLSSYMQKIFIQICNKKNYIALDINQLNKEYLYNIGEIWETNQDDVWNGYVKWRDVFIDKNNNVKFDDICKLFPNSRFYAIRSGVPVEKQLNKYKCINSIKITDKLINESLKVLTSKECACKSIYIYSPLNNLNSLQELIKKI